MKNTDLPPLPPPQHVGPEVCQVIGLYLAVWDDLSDQQRATIAAHLEICDHCAHERRLLGRLTGMIASLDASNPSPHVDRAIRAAIATRHNQDSSHSVRFPARPTRKRSWRLGWLAAAIVTLLLALLGVTRFLSLPFTPSQEVFALPANLTWNAYVLHYSQTKISAQGEPYKIDCYRELATGRVHVETVMPGKVDVVAVSDKNEVLGKDMMHNVAQWDAQEWSIDEPMFDLAQLRRDLQSGQAVYAGKGIFNRQEVYRIRYSNGHVLLLDMHYMPVNVLEDESSTVKKPMYDTFRLLPSTQVSATMWDMQVPPGFKMGKLPEKPR
jgi:hypothetical protein